MLQQCTAPFPTSRRTAATSTAAAAASRCERMRDEKRRRRRTTDDAKTISVAVLPSIERGDRDKSCKRSTRSPSTHPLIYPPLYPPHEYRRLLLHRDRHASLLARSSPGPRRGPRHRRRRVLCRRRPRRRRRRPRLSSPTTPAAPRSPPSPRRSWSWDRLRDLRWPFLEEEVRFCVNF